MLLGIRPRVVSLPPNFAAPAGCMVSASFHIMHAWEPVTYVAGHVMASVAHIRVPCAISCQDVKGSLCHQLSSTKVCTHAPPEFANTTAQCLHVQM